jgi:3-dehydroquinate dehydratase II
MLRIIIINGPNLNLLGTREPAIYGHLDFDSFLAKLRGAHHDLQLDYYQSNNEGNLIDKLHEAAHTHHAVVLNGGAYSHTSIAIADAVAAINISVIEVHISNVYAREAYRQNSYIAAKCVGTITGLGLEGYALAVQYLVGQLGPKTT